MSKTAAMEIRGSGRFGVERGPTVLTAVGAIATRGEVSTLPSTLTVDDLTSDLSVYNGPLDGGGSDFDNVEYAQTMRRIGIVEGELGTPVSAFNSSI